MPSTYTLNNGITLIATGEQSGTWGSTTNTNLELVDTALDGQVTVTLASAGTSGSPNDLPISDGSASNGRNRLIIFNDGGDLGATAYVQLTPNDAEKIIYVRNALSGSRSILLFQGTYSASNDYEVPAGATAIVYFDGAGTGAVAANVFNNAYFDGLRLGSVSVTAILDEDNMASDSATALATQQSIKAYVDSQVGTVDTLAEILANGNTTGANNIIVTAGQSITTNTISETTAASGVTVDSLLIKDGGITAAGTSTFAGQTISNLGSVTTADINGGTIDGTTIGGSSAAAITGTTITGTSFVSSGDMTFGDGDKAIFGTGGDLEIYHSGTSSYIRDAGDGDLQLFATDDVYIRGTATNNYMARFNENGAVDLYHNNAVKLATTSTGIDVTGTVTADGAQIDSTTQAKLELNTTATTGTGSLIEMMHDRTGPSVTGYGDTLGQIDHIFRDSAGNYDVGVRVIGAMGGSSGDNTNGAERTAYTIQTLKGSSTLSNSFKIDRNGDISFYDSTGTSQNLFWDASASALGIGTTSPSSILHLSSSGTTVRTIAESTNAAGYVGYRATNGTGYWEMQVDGANQGLRWLDDGTERMRIDSSGNLLVGTTSASGSGDGIVLGANDQVIATRNGAAPLWLNRRSNDGDIALFNKDGTTVGSIGTQNGSDFYIGSSPATIGLRFQTNEIVPVSATGANKDAAIDVGKSNIRFKDLYLSGGVYLGGTGSANKLDDYEEGTWTPTFSYGTIDPTSITYSIRDGEYTKVGNIVYVTGVIATTALSGGSGDFRIIDLPFTVRNSLVSTGSEGSMMMRYKLGGAVDGKYVGYFNDGTQHVISFTNKSDISGTLTPSDFSASTSLRFDGWYRTDD